MAARCTVEDCKDGLDTKERLGDKDQINIDNALGDLWTKLGNVLTTRQEVIILTDVGSFLPMLSFLLSQT